MGKFPPRSVDDNNVPANTELLKLANQFTEILGCLFIRIGFRCILPDLDVCIIVVGALDQFVDFIDKFCKANIFDTGFGMPMSSCSSTSK